MTNSTAPRTTIPVVPSMEIMSPSWMTVSVPETAGFLLLRIDAESLDTADAGSAHAASDNGGVGGLAAMRGQNAFGGNHAGEVVGVGFPADEHAFATLGLGRDGVSGGKDRFTHGSAGRCVQAACEHIVFCVLVELRMQKLVELLGIDAANRLFLGDEAFFDHLDRNMQSSGGRTLAHTSLQHPELALLNGELDIADVVIVILEGYEDLLELAPAFCNPSTCLSSAMGLVLRMPATTSSP